MNSADTTFMTQTHDKCGDEGGGERTNVVRAMWLSSSIRPSNTVLISNAVDASVVGYIIIIRREELYTGTGETKEQMESRYNTRTIVVECVSNCELVLVVVVVVVVLENKGEEQ